MRNAPGIISLYVLDTAFSLDLLQGNYGVLFMMRGDTEVAFREETVRLAEEDVLFLRCGEEFRVAPGKGALAGIAVLDRSTFSPYFAAGLAAFPHKPEEVPADVRTELREQMLALFSFYPDHGESDAALLAARAFELAGLLVRGCRPSGDTGRDQALGDLISDYLRTHYREHITLSALSEITYYSESFLSRFIQRRFGKSFTQYLTELRLEQAENMVVSTRVPFLQIAADCGFPNTGSFNRAFRLAYGLTPTEYRKQATAAEARIPRPDPEQERIISDLLEQKRLEHDPETPQVSRLTADLAVSTPLHHFWDRMINIGFARDLLKSGVQSHILLLKQELLFTHVRFWDLWADEMMLYDGNPDMRFNYSRLDAVMDFLHENGLFPYMEIGLKPGLLSRGIGSSIYGRQQDSVFADAKDYALFAGRLLEHYIRRYDADYVSHWMLELWCDSHMKSPQHYADLFDAVAGIAKKTVPGIRLGGMGMVHEQSHAELRFEEFLTIWSGAKTRPDFISLYLFPYEFSFLPLDDTGKSAPSAPTPYTGTDFVPRFLASARKSMERTGFGDTPLHLSEWGFTVSNRNSLNDSLFKGACLAKMMTEMIGKVDLAGYMYASDLISEYYDSADLLHGGNGLLTRDGIPKPAFYAFRFFRRLHERVLAAYDNALITCSQRGEISILCHNYCHPNSRYYDWVRSGDLSWNIADQQDFFVGNERVKKLVFVIEGIPDGIYYVKKRTVDSRRGSVQDEWLRIGGEAVMGQDVVYLDHICVPTLAAETAECTDGRLEFSTVLQPHAIEQIYIFPKSE